MKARRRLLLPETLVFALALWVCGASFAYAATFTQSGNTVQITTINDLASWSVDIHYSDTTESPIPTTSEKLWNSITVPSGQTAFSFVMPSEHRRYRFDVNSVRPSSAATDTMAMPSWQDHAGASFPERRWELWRGAAVIETGTVNSLTGEVQGMDGKAVQVGDSIRARLSASTVAASAINITRAGTLKHNTLRLDLINLGDEYVDDVYINWAGAPVVTYGAAAVDDGGTGTFENPDWTGFLEPTTTPDPTPTVEPTSAVITSGTVGVSALGSLDSAGLDALLAVIAFTAGLVTWRSVVPHA